MLKGLAFRLGFILCLSLGIRVVGLLSPHQLKPIGPMIGMSDRSGDGHLPPADLAGPGRGLTSDKRPGDSARDEQPGEISFEPGQPMIDPTPRH